MGRAQGHEDRAFLTTYSLLRPAPSSPIRVSKSCSVLWFGLQSVSERSDRRAPAAPLAESTPQPEHGADVIAAVLEGGVLVLADGAEPLGNIRDGAHLG